MTSIPPSPPASQAIFTVEEAAGYLRVTRSRLNQLRAEHPEALAPRLLSAGSPRWRRVDLDRWIESLPTGWSTRGGKRTKVSA